MNIYEDFVQKHEVLDYLIDPDIREPYAWPCNDVCTKCGNKVLEYGGGDIHCWKCGTWWFL